MKSRIVKVNALNMLDNVLKNQDGKDIEVEEFALKYFPFGNPDASRVDLNPMHKLKETYIDLTKSETRNKRKKEINVDPAVRIILGRKGSGKTLYLRGIHDYCKNRQEVDETGIYVSDIDNTNRSTDSVIKITYWYSRSSERTNKWRDIWEKIIYKTLWTHIMYSNALNKNLSYKNLSQSELVDYFKATYPNIFPDTKMPVSLLSQFHHTINQFNTPKHLESYLKHSEWPDLEHELEKILPQLPPSYFFIDQIDDDLMAGPQAWLHCSVGLFKVIMQLINSPKFGGRLHIVACFREMVYAHLLASENGDRIISDAKIKVLKWDESRALFFLRKKIELMPKEIYQSKISTDDPIRDFFGFDKMTVKRNGEEMEEDISSYIIRHTLSLPRDIINIGNIFYNKMHETSKVILPKDALREAVHIVAKQIAVINLSIAAMFITNNWLSYSSADDGTIDSVKDINSTKVIFSQLSDIILKINCDRFTKRKFITIIEGEKFKELITENPFEALYQAGLLGYEHTYDNGVTKTKFFSESRSTNLKLSPHIKNFVFHSCLIDLFHIKSSKNPVYAAY